jgi:hypothetical protein
VRDKNFSDSRIASFVTLLFLGFLPPVFFWRETLGRLTLGDQDAVFWFFPAYKFVSEQIRSGNLPLWTPYLYSGSPLFAQWQAGMLDPINWIYLIETTSRTLTLSLEISFAISLIATFVYTRSLGFKRRASVISAVIYSLSGFAVGRTLYPGFLHIVALTPLVLFFVERLYQRNRWRDMAGGALIITWQVFAAHPQPLIYSSLLACAYALFRLRIAGLNPQSAIENPRSAIKFLFQFALMFIAGMGLAAVQLLPAWEIAGQSVRREWPYELFTLHSLHPVSLLTTLFPFFHGSGQAIYRMKYWGVYWHHNEAQIYLGLIALALALAGAIYAWRSRYRIGVFWSVVAVAGIILSLGKYSGPVARALYHVPVISHFRSPNRHWMEVALAAAVLAGYAVDRLLREDARSLARYAQIAATGLALLCCLVGSLVLWRKDLAEAIIRGLPDLGGTPQGFLQAAGAEFYLPAISAVIASAVLIAFVRLRRRWYWPLLIALLIDFNLYAAFAPIGNPFKLETLIGRAMPESLAAEQSEHMPIRYHVMLNAVTGEFSPFWFYGHEMATGYDPMLNERYKIFSGMDEAGRSFSTTILEPRDRTLDLLNVRYVLVPPVMLTSALNDATRWRELSERSQAEPYRDYRIFENLKAFPRAWLVDRIKTAYEGDQLKLIRGGTASDGDAHFDPTTTALVDHATAAKLGFSGSNGGQELGGAKIIGRKPTRMLIETKANQPAILVLSEIAFPGWKVEVNGKIAEAIQINYYMRGIALPAGNNRVEIVYRPGSLKIGVIVSIVTAVCLLSVALWERRGSRF